MNKQTLLCRVLFSIHYQVLLSNAALLNCNQPRGHQENDLTTFLSDSLIQVYLTLTCKLPLTLSHYLLYYSCCSYSGGYQCTIMSLFSCFLLIIKLFFVFSNYSHFLLINESTDTFVDK